MKSSILFSFFAACFIFSQSAHAFLYLEPYVGYEQSTVKSHIKGTAPAPINAFDLEDGDSLHGGVFGGRAGLSFLLLAAGVDYSMGTLSDTDVKDLGAFVQVTLPLGIKFGATYIIASELKGEDDGVSTVFKGSGLKLGIGYSFLPFIRMNLDYINATYDEATSSGVTFTSVDVKRSGGMLSLSIPIDI